MDSPFYNFKGCRKMLFIMINIRLLKYSQKLIYQDYL